MLLISALASFPVAVAAAFYFYSNTVMFYTILLALAITVVVISLLRSIFHMERPSAKGINKHVFHNKLHGKMFRLLRHRFDELNQRSFASGHVARAVLFGTALFFFGYSYSWIVVAGIFAIIIAFSRLYLKKHRLIDIITGATVGVGSVYASFYILTILIF